MKKNRMSYSFLLHGLPQYRSVRFFLCVSFCQHMVFLSAGPCMLCDFFMHGLPYYGSMLFSFHFLWDVQSI